MTIAIVSFATKPATTIPLSNTLFSEFHISMVGMSHVFVIRQGVARCFLLASVVVFPSTAALPIHQAPQSTIELTAIRATLTRYRPGQITIDSVFAVPDQAPPPMTSRVRPAPRQRALIDSLQSVAAQGGADTLRVLASEPQIRGDTASICVTVERRSGGLRRHFYETVAFVLHREESRWVVHSRTQLGIS